jgi:multidrug resistance efflux pump
MTHQESQMDKLTRARTRRDAERKQVRDERDRLVVLVASGVLSADALMRARANIKAANYLMERLAK